MTHLDEAMVAEFAAALAEVGRGQERARRGIPDASRLAILHLIRANQPVRPSDLAAELQVHQSLTTRQVQALEEAGHVVVSQSKHDRRVILVSLTEAGERELARLHEIGISRFRLFLSEWSAEEVTEFTRLLRKFERSTAKHGKSRAQAPQRRRGRRTGGEDD